MTKKYNPPRTPHIRDFLGKILRPTLKKRGLAQFTLIENWSLIVGEHLATYSHPVRLTRGGAEGGTLTVAVEGAMAVEIQHLSPQIIDRINAHYGYDAIGKLHIIQAPL